MKRIATTLVLIAAVLGTLQAAPVGPEQARQAAANFWNTHRPPAAKPAANIALRTLPGLPHLHIAVVDQQGFVILPADDNIMPILAYSFSDPFPESLNPELRYWLGGYEAQIAEALEQGLASADAQRQWQRVLTDPVPPTPITLVDVPALCTTRWEQGQPYNNLCPYDSAHRDRTVVGCVATAMAQILKYWNHPSCGTGQHSFTHHGYPDTSFSLGTFSADFENTTYIWEYMPNTLSSFSPAQYIKAVATLSYHCGVAVDMMYGISAQGGSGAYSSCGWWATACAENAFVDYFKYKPTVEHRNRTSMTNDEWIAKIDSNISAGMPIYYSGSDPTGGHAFVLDGADLEGRYHFNWGWAGYGDGFYTIDNLNPGGSGTGGNATYTFNRDQGAIFGIAPDITPLDTIDLYDTICNTNTDYTFYDYTFRVQSDTLLHAVNLTSYYRIHLAIVGNRKAYIDPNGGSGLMTPVTFCPAEGFTLPECSFSRPGFLFVGWCTASDGSERIYQPGEIAAIRSPRTFYALWSDTTQHDPTLGIGSLDSEGIALWPNPASDLLHLRLTGSASAQLTLFDALGRVAASMRTSGSEAQMSLHGLPTGTYILRISTPEAIFNKRIIKQ